MMAAAALTSGTRSPPASTLYRGRMVLAISRAVATARPRASVALRVAARSAEYAGRRTLACVAAVAALACASVLGAALAGFDEVAGASEVVVCAEAETLARLRMPAHADAVTQASVFCFT